MDLLSRPCEWRNTRKPDLGSTLLRELRRANYRVPATGVRRRALRCISQGQDGSTPGRRPPRRRPGSRRTGTPHRHSVPHCATASPPPCKVRARGRRATRRNWPNLPPQTPLPPPARNNAEDMTAHRRSYHQHWSNLQRQPRPDPPPCGPRRQARRTSPAGRNVSALARTAQAARRQQASLARWGPARRQHRPDRIPNHIRVRRHAAHSICFGSLTEQQKPGTKQRDRRHTAADRAWIERFGARLAVNGRPARGDRARTRPATGRLDT